jgi:large subunit ribosomal protein L24
MKSEFSTNWVASKRPSKQRKYRFQAPLHIKHKFLSAHSSKDLRKKYGKRSLPLRKGDEVLVMRGAFKKKKAKVSLVNLKYGFVCLEGLQRTKKDGTKVNISFNPSNLLVQTLAEDKLRFSQKAAKTEPDKKTSVQEKPKEK